MNKPFAGLPPLAPLVITIMIVIGMGAIVLGELHDSVENRPEHVDRICESHGVDGVVVNGTEYPCVLAGPDYVDRVCQNNCVFGGPYSSLDFVFVIPVVVLVGALIYLRLLFKE